jgi:GTP-binding protein
MTPLVAIVGRPNVGKSTLFNRLVRSRRAIVQDDPGVTRDRNYGTAQFEGRRFTLVDTGGFEPSATAGIEGLIREQTQLAVEEADLILLVLDARQGLTEGDREVWSTLRRTGKSVLHVVNKVDGPAQEILAAEFFAAGAERLHQVSAEHGLGFESLIDAILSSLPQAAVPATAASPETGEDAVVRVALIGRPNAGKSSLLNRMVGQERAIVSPTPGTTRDPVDVRLDTDRGSFVVVDTAGIRRRRSIASTMEKYAVLRALNSVNHADVTCLIMDATVGVAEHDAKIAGLALEAGKGLVLVFTKADLLPAGPGARRKLKEDVRDKLQFVPFAPTLFVSAVTGAGTRRLLPTVRRIYQACGTRIPTAELNRFLEEAAAAHPPPAARGRPVRFYYMVQPQAYPPTFLVSTNHSDAIHLTYRRYFVNRLRDRFGFEGAPLRLFFRNRRRREAR